MRPAIVSGGGLITIEPPDDEIQAYLRRLQERLDAANAKRAELYREQDGLGRARAANRRRESGPPSV